jgi:hypothetical protein
MRLVNKSAIAKTNHFHLRLRIIGMYRAIELKAETIFIRQPVASANSLQYQITINLHPAKLEYRVIY